MEKEQNRVLIKKIQESKVTNVDLLSKIIGSEYSMKTALLSRDEIMEKLKSGSIVFVSGGGVIVDYNMTNDSFSSIDGRSMNLYTPVYSAFGFAEKIKQGGDSDRYIIFGSCEWGELPVNEYAPIAMATIDELYIPDCSIVLNFKNSTPGQINNGICSSFTGLDINIFSPDMFMDNLYHEIGHHYERTRLTNTERQLLINYFNNDFSRSPLYQFDWECTSWKEMFCTIYKFFLKGLYENNSFYNILEKHESKGYKILKDIFERIAKDKVASLVWDGVKDDIMKYYFPVTDSKSGMKISVTSSVIKEQIQVPSELKENIVAHNDGIDFIEVEKNKFLPTKDGFVFNEMRKAKPLPSDTVIYFDMDGVVANFEKKYFDISQRDCNQDDQFTVLQTILFHCPAGGFFSTMPAIEKGLKLYDELKKRKYKVVFLSSPLEGYEGCREEKIKFLQNVLKSDFEIIFDKDKAKYALHDQCFLIDDLKANIDLFTAAGGIGIDSKKSIIDIMRVIEKDESVKLKRQIRSMKVDINPTEKQKEPGQYKKGDIDFKGLKIKIENPKGSIRFGFDELGKKWFNKINHHYGYIVSSQGSDKDPIDVFIGDNGNTSKVFIVNQVNPSTNIFDEHKIMLGFDNISQAREACLSNYEKGWRGCDSIVQTNITKLKQWIKEGDIQREYKNNK